MALTNGSLKQHTATASGQRRMGPKWTSRVSRAVGTHKHIKTSCLKRRFHALPSHAFSGPLQVGGGSEPHPGLTKFDQILLLIFHSPIPTQILYIESMAN
jgi:hypothetical protein